MKNPRGGGLDAPPSTPFPPSLEAKPALSPDLLESNNILSSRRRRKSKSRLLRDERKEKGEEREVKRRRSPIHPWLNNLSFQTDSTSTFLLPSSSPSKPACRLFLHLSTSQNPIHFAPSSSALFPTLFPPFISFLPAPPAPIDRTEGLSVRRIRIATP